MRTRMLSWNATTCGSARMRNFKMVRDERQSMIDWARNRKLLIENSERIIRGLMTDHRESGDEIVAVGYVFELTQPLFGICANSSSSLKASLEECDGDNEAAEEVRWNSGDFDYSGNVDDHYDGFSEELRGELRNLGRLARIDSNKSMIYDGVVRMCCEALADLVKRKVIDDPSKIDFNVSDLDDDLETVKARDEFIRRLIASSA